MEVINSDGMRNRVSLGGGMAEWAALENVPLRKRIPVSLNFDNIGTLANIICLLGSNYRKCCPYLLVLGMNILMLTFMSLNDFYENSSIFKKILTPPSSH